MGKGCSRFRMLQLLVWSNDFHETFILAIFCNKICWADASFEQNRAKIPDTWHGGPQTCLGAPWCKSLSASLSEKWFPSRLHENATHMLYAQWQCPCHYSVFRTNWKLSSNISNTRCSGKISIVGSRLLYFKDGRSTSRKAIFTYLPNYTVLNPIKITILIIYRDPVSEYCETTTDKFYVYVYGSVHRWSILITVQRDATQSSLFIILQVHSICFGC